MSSRYWLTTNLKDITMRALRRVVSEKKISAVHAEVHPFRAEEGLYHPRLNPGGCDKYWCAWNVPRLVFRRQRIEKPL